MATPEGDKAEILPRLPLGEMGERQIIRMERVREAAKLIIFSLILPFLLTLAYWKVSQ